MKSFIEQTEIGDKVGLIEGSALSVKTPGKFTLTGLELGMEDGIELGSYGVWLPPPHTQHAEYAFFPLYQTLTLGSLHQLSVKVLHPYWFVPSENQYQPGSSTH